MEDKDIVRLAAVGVICLIIVPVVANTMVTIVAHTTVGIANTVNKIKFNKKIKKGLKDGSITEVDGEYYEVGPVKEA